MDLLQGAWLTVWHPRRREHLSHRPHPHRGAETEPMPPRLVMLLLMRPRHRQVKMGLRRHLRDSKLDLLLRRRAEQLHRRHRTVWLLHRRHKAEITQF